MFNDLVLNLGIKEKNEKYYINSIKLEETTIAVVISASVDLSVSVEPIDWSFYPTDATLNSYETYVK